MFMSILGFFLRMCIYAVFAVGMFIPIGFLIGSIEHDKKVRKMEQRQRELFGDDD